MTTEPSGEADGPGATEAVEGVYALLTDGTTVLIRPARPQDAQAVRQMHAQMSPSNIYLRFFSISPLSADREPTPAPSPPNPNNSALWPWPADESERAPAETQATKPSRIPLLS